MKRIFPGFRGAAVLVAGMLVLTAGSAVAQAKPTAEDA